MLKKAISFFLIATLLFVFSACDDSSTRTPIKPDETETSSQAGPDAPEDALEGDDLIEDQDAPRDITIENSVLLEQDGLTITATGLDYDVLWGWGVKVLVENNSDQNLGVQCNSLIVNNYMISDLFSCTVAAGKKANDTIYLSSFALEEAGINIISDIVISFHVFDGDSYATLFDTDEIEIRTSEYGSVDQPAMDDGKELFNQDGIRIIGKYVEEDSFWGAGILLFIENQYDENIIVQCDNMSINGYMVMPLFSSTVNRGRMALDEITILSSDLEDNNIEKIEEIELIFQIINPETYQTLIETDPIIFSTI